MDQEEQILGRNVRPLVSNTHILSAFYLLLE